MSSVHVPASTWELCECPYDIPSHVERTLCICLWKASHSPSAVLMPSSVAMGTTKYTKYCIVSSDSYQGFTLHPTRTHSLNDRVDFLQAGTSIGFTCPRKFPWDLPAFVHEPTYNTPLESKPTTKDQPGR